jgi:hypothetical protein
VAVYVGHGDRVVEFAETYIRQAKGRWAGEPLRFERWQRSFVDELFLVDEEGRLVIGRRCSGWPARTARAPCRPLWRCMR